VPAEAAAETPRTIPDLAGNWTIDPARSTVRFRTKALWIVTVNGAFHVTEGTGTVDANGRVSGRLTIDAGSIDTKNKRRDEHLRHEAFLEVDTYPQMVFDVTAAELSSPGTGTIEGDLTIRDVRRPLRLLATMRTEDERVLVLDAQAEIDRSDWSIPWAKMGAGLKNSVTITATFLRQP
jgi:polyisoprenoid-binding protein YceI